MANLFEKSVNLGLGIFAYSRDKVEDLVDDLVNKGEVAKKDAREFASELLKRGEEQRNELKNLIREGVEETLKSDNVATKDDMVTKEEIKQIVREQVMEILKEQGVIKD